MSSHRMPWKYGTVIRRVDQRPENRSMVVAPTIDEEPVGGVGEWWDIVPLDDQPWRHHAVNLSVVWEVIDD